MSILSQIPNPVLIIGALVLVVIVFRLVRSHLRRDPLRCPKCGSRDSRDLGWYDVGVPGQDGLLDYKSCNSCCNRWSVYVPETGPSPYRNIP